MDTSLSHILGDNVQRARIDSGLTKQRFCLMIGISRPFLTSIERGEANVSLKTITRLADGLAVEPWQLLREYPSQQ